MTNENLLLLKLLGTDLRNNWPVWKKKHLNALTRWRNELIVDSTKLLVLLFCCGIGYLVLLYYLQSIWSVFAATPMGNTFATRVSPELGDLLNDT